MQASSTGSNVGHPRRVAGIAHYGLQGASAKPSIAKDRSPPATLLHPRGELRILGTLCVRCTGSTIMTDAVAAVTKRIRLGLLVGCAFYRHPVLLARQVADVDRVSDGRVVLGLGIGDAPQEFAQLGLRYGSPRERQEMLEELVQVVSALWGEEPITFSGRHVKVAEARVQPGPVQQPHVPVLIAGGGERVTLRQVAQYADASNFGAGNLTGNAWTSDDVSRKYEALREHCRAFNRPYESILRTYVNFGLELGEGEPSSVLRSHVAAFDFSFDRFVGTPRDAVEYYRALAGAGVQYFIASIRGDDPNVLRLLAEEVVPEVVGS